MATFSQKDITRFYIGAAATKTTGAIDAMNDGEIGIFTPAGARITEATAATVDEFIIVKKTASGGIPLVSGPIKKADISTAKRVVYTASTSKVVNIGYDGTSGSIDTINDNSYHVRVNMREGRTSNHGGLYVKHGFYTSDASATQAEIGSALHKALIAEFSKEPDSLVLTELLCNHAGAALGAAADTVVGVSGSKYLVVTDTGADSSVTAVAAGDFIRIGTGTTDEVYKVVTGIPVTGGTIELDAPLQAAVNLLGTTSEVITAAQAATADFGLRLTGIEPTHRVGKLHNDLQPTNFDVTLQNFGTTGNVVATAATPGIGTEKQVKEMEWFFQGNEGDFFRMGEPYLFDSRTEASGNYDLITLNTVENYQGSIVSGPIHKTFMIALPETAPNYAIAGTADDITDVLEVLAFGSANGNLAVT